MQFARLAKAIFSVLITIIILYFLFRIISLKDIVSAISKIPLRAIFLSSIFYLLSYVLKTFRFMELNGRNIKFKRMFSVVCIHSFFSIIIPAKIGELSYVYLMAKEPDNSAEKGIATLVLARIMDIGMVFLSLFLGLILFRKQLGLEPDTYWWLSGTVCFILVLSAGVYYFKDKIFVLAKKTVEILSLKKVNFILSCLDRLKKSVGYLKSIPTKKTLFLSVFYSLGIIFTHYLFFYSILKGLGLEISFIQVIIGSIILLVAAAIPLQGAAGFGTYEGAWSLALIFLGFSPEISIGSSFVIHIFQLVYLIALGIAGMAYYRLLPDKGKVKKTIQKNQEKEKIIFPFSCK